MQHQAERLPLLPQPRRGQQQKIKPCFQRIGADMQERRLVLRKAELAACQGALQLAERGERHGAMLIARFVRHRSRPSWLSQHRV
jgi:hypothetical protein